MRKPLNREAGRITGRDGTRGDFRSSIGPVSGRSRIGDPETSGDRTEVSVLTE
jgi:hypothetical protein